MSAVAVVRPYRDADEHQVLALWRETLSQAGAHNDPRASIRRKLDVQRELLLVAEEGGTVLGTAMAGYDGHRGWLYSVAVSPAHRRRGIGRLLISRAEEALRALGCPKVNLQAHPRNTGAVEFYRAIGYDVEERVSMGKVLGGA